MKRVTHILSLIVDNGAFDYTIFIIFKIKCIIYRFNESKADSRSCSAKLVNVALFRLYIMTKEPYLIVIVNTVVC